MKLTPFVEYVRYDLFSESDPITIRSMMGGYMFSYEGKAFALIDNDELYFKGSEALASWYESRGGKQFSYMRAGKRAHLYYYRAPESVLENHELFRKWTDTALSVATLPKKK